LGDSLVENVIRPFEAETGMTVEVAYGGSRESAARVRAGLGNPDVDVAMMGIQDGPAIWSEGLSDTLNSIPNVSLMRPEAVRKDGDAVFWIGYYGITYHLVWRKDLVPEPENWDSLWEPEYCGKVIMPDPTAFGSFAQIYTARMHGGDENNMDPAWPLLRELAPCIGVVPASDADFSNALASGEGAVGMVTDYTSLTLIDQGIDLGLKPLELGSFFGMDGITIPKNAPNPEGARAFVDFMLRPDIAAKHAIAIKAAPTVIGAELPPDLAEVFPTTTEEWAALYAPDPQAYINFREGWLETWNREIVPLIGSN